MLTLKYISLRVILGELSTMTTGEGHFWSGTRRRSIFVYFFNKSFAWCSRAEGARGMELRDTKERILMYADDWALIAESAELKTNTTEQQVYQANYMRPSV